MIAELTITLAALFAILWVMITSPATKSLAEEKRELLEYFKKKDAADRRGERFPR